MLFSGYLVFIYLFIYLFIYVFGIYWYVMSSKKRAFWSTDDIVAVLNEAMANYDLHLVSCFVSVHFSVGVHVARIPAAAAVLSTG